MTFRVFPDQYEPAYVLKNSKHTKHIPFYTKYFRNGNTKLSYKLTSKTKDIQTNSVLAPSISVIETQNSVISWPVH